MRSVPPRRLYIAEIARGKSLPLQEKRRAAMFTVSARIASWNVQARAVILAERTCVIAGKWNESKQMEIGEVRSERGVGGSRLGCFE